MVAMWLIKERRKRKSADVSPSFRPPTSNFQWVSGRKGDEHTYEITPADLRVY